MTSSGQNDENTRTYVFVYVPSGTQQAVIKKL